MADTKSSANVPASGGSGGAAPSLGERVAGFFRAPANGGVLKRKTSSTSRFIVGSITFILVAELLTYAIDYANIKFNLNLNQPILPGNSATWFSWFFLINVVIILGLWILLNKMGFFPRDMWAPRNGTTNSTARGGSSSSSGSSNRNSSKDNANQIPGIGGTRTRAERRHAAAVADAAAVAAAVKSKKKGNGATAATTATKPAKRGAVIEEVKVGSEHDAAYDRAKAAQRQRMRRARR
ncbi:MAG TPA: hypothetical protein VHI51_17705 [Ktedonobacterales bacterium]|jgi:hypothetical protein|nr:hypothetical protein [Ktedonobacterales bacterium]